MVLSPSRDHFLELEGAKLSLSHPKGTIYNAIQYFPGLLLDFNLTCQIEPALNAQKETNDRSRLKNN